MGDVKAADEADKGRLLSELRVADLKAELEKRGLESSGVKIVLTVRLNKAMQEEGLQPTTHRFFNIGTAATPAAARSSTRKEPRKIEALAKMSQKTEAVETQCETTRDEKKEEDDDDSKGELRIDEGNTSFDELKQEIESQQISDTSDNKAELEKVKNEEVQDVEQVPTEDVKLEIEGEEQIKTEETHKEVDNPEISTSVANAADQDKNDEEKKEEITVEKHLVGIVEKVTDQEEVEEANDGNQNKNDETPSEIVVELDEQLKEDTVDGEDEEDNDIDDEEEYEDEQEQQLNDEQEEEEEGKQIITIQHDEDMLEDPLNESTRKSETPQPISNTPSVQNQPKEQQIQEAQEATSTSSVITNKETIGDVDDPLPRSLWIRGLTAETSAACLKQLCMEYGKVQRAKIFNSKTKKCDVTTCFGYVTFSEQSMSEKCLAGMNGTIVNNHELRLERATESSLIDNTMRRNIKKPNENSKFENFKIVIKNDPEPKRESSKDRKEREEREKARRERKPIVYKNSPDRKKKSPIGSRNGSEPREIKTSQRRITAAVTSASSRAPRQYITTRSQPMTESLIIRTRVSPVGVDQHHHRSVERGIQNISTSSLRRNKPVVTIPAHSHQSRSMETGDYRRREDQTRSRERDRERERENERERERQKERELAEILRRKEEEHRQRERELELQRERDRIRFEKEKLERERLEFELQKQKLAFERSREGVSNNTFSSRGHSDSRTDSSRYSRDTDRRNDTSTSSSSSHRNQRDSRRDCSSRRRYEDVNSPPRKMHTDDRDSRRRDGSSHIGSSRGAGNSVNSNVYGIQSSSTRAYTNPINSFGTQDYAASSSSRYATGTFADRIMGADLINLERHIGVPTAYQSAGPLPTWGGLNDNGELDIGSSEVPWNGPSANTSSGRGGADWDGYDSRGNRQQSSSQYYRNGY